MAIIIKNTKVINYNQTVNNADIEIEGTIITKVIPLSGQGATITIPGFIDTHVHGGGGHDFMDNDPQAIANIRALLAKHGVTDILATIMTGPPNDMLTSLKSLVHAKGKGANILGIHAEGPFISLEKKGAHDPLYLQESNQNFLKKMYDASKGKLRKITYAPEVGNTAFIKFARQLGIVVSIGHSNATYQQAMEAFENGATCLTHLWNAMSGVANRNPGIVQAGMLWPNAYAELIVDLIHLDEATTRLTLETIKPERIVIVSDAIRPFGLPDGESTSGGLAIIKKGPLITLKDTDTIAGSGSSIYNEFINLVTKFGVTLNDAVRMTSYNAAQNLQIKNLGEIKPGNTANLVVLNNKLQIAKVYIHGEIQ